MMGWSKKLRDEVASALRPGLQALATLHVGDRVASAVNRLAELGTAGYPPETKRRLMILNMIAYLITLTNAVYACQQATLDFNKYWPIVVLNTVLAIIVLFVPVMHRFGEIAGAALILTSEYIALFIFTALLGRTSGIHLQYFVIAAAAFVVFGLHRIWLVLGTIAVGAALHIAAWFCFQGTHTIIEAERDVLDSIYVQAAITTFCLISASVYYAFRLAENAKAETDALLRNILPDSVVERLKARPAEAVADSFTEASILFADITGFVPLARSLGVGATVKLLNDIVTRFDALSERHGVEKIKTIGDAYMAASGIPEANADHIARLARMAIDMQALMAELRRETGLDLNIRIGLAAGPVMAGVIGQQKFSYDVWGDAVNLAARLENSSAPGRIHVCPSSKSMLERGFELESRGLVDIKGVGEQETWFLLAERGVTAPAAD